MKPGSSALPLRIARMLWLHRRLLLLLLLLRTSVPQEKLPWSRRRALNL